jgi:PBSX family phage portal protein
MPITKSKVSARRTGEISFATRATQTEVDKDEAIQKVMRGDLSHAIADPFKEQNLYDFGAAGDFRIMSPPVSLPVLMRMPNDNSILRQCLEAMVINTEGHGHRLEYIGPEGEEKSAEALAEKEHIEAFLKTLHPELSVTELRKRLRWDLEVFGFAFLEVLRDKQGLPIGLTHVPAQTMRVTTVDPTLVPVKTEGMRFGKRVDAITKRRFRRYVQIIGTQKVWFKEFGDPRSLSPIDGKDMPGLAFEDSATEVIFLKQYVTGQVYGLPRWFNNLVAIQGSRQAELTNLDYFKENAIPALAVLVSGGFLHQETVEHIEEHVTAARGRASQNRVLVIEVEGNAESASRDGVVPAPRVELKPLAADRPQDGLFLEYDKAQTDKVRSSFRLPPIFTGHAQDYSHASAKTSYEVAEGQVFGPERAYIDETLNRNVLAPYGVKFWEVRSNPPRISDPEEVIKAITAFNTVGALTPNIAIGLANEQFGLDIQPITESWGDFPFEIVKAMAAAGRLEGLDKITKEVEEGVDPVTGQKLVQPGAKGQPDPNKVDDKDKPEVKVKKQVRAALTSFHEMLDDARINAYSPPLRPRVAVTVDA